MSHVAESRHQLMSMTYEKNWQDSSSSQRRLQAESPLANLVERGLPPPHCEAPPDGTATGTSHTLW